MKSAKDFEVEIPFPRGLKGSLVMTNSDSDNILVAAFDNDSAMLGLVKAFTTLDDAKKDVEDKLALMRKALSLHENFVICNPPFTEEPEINAKFFWYSYPLPNGMLTTTCCSIPMLKTPEMKWFECTHVTFLMRQTYHFRMIGKKLFCSPKKLNKMEVI